MARVAGRTVIGVERSEDQIREAMRQAREEREEGLLEIRRGDAHDLPLSSDEWGTFDLVHTRFVLEHLPDPLRIVQQMVRAARTGGRVVLVDDDHEILHLYPDVPGFLELWQAYMKTFSLLGNDPIVGRKLISLLYDAGAKPLRNSWVFFGSCSGEDSFNAYINNLTGVIATAKEQIVRHGLFDPKRFDETIAGVQSWRQKPDAALWYAVAWAEGSVL